MRWSWSPATTRIRSCGGNIKPLVVAAGFTEADASCPLYWVGYSPESGEEPTRSALLPSVRIMPGGKPVSITLGKCLVLVVDDEFSPLPSSHLSACLPAPPQPRPSPPTPSPVRLCTPRPQNAHARPLQASLLRRHLLRLQLR